MHMCEFRGFCYTQRNVRLGREKDLYSPQVDYGQWRRASVHSSIVAGGWRRRTSLTFECTADEIVAAADLGICRVCGIWCENGIIMELLPWEANMSK
jgi:hypothetical protein